MNIDKFIENYNKNSIFKSITEIDDKQIYFCNNNAVDNDDDDDDNNDKLPDIISILQMLEKFYDNNNNFNISILSILEAIFNYNDNNIEMYCNRIFFPKHNIKNSVSI